MFFHSFAFVAFFCVVFAIYWSLRSHRARMVWLLLASCGFYMSWNPWLITLILFSASVDYFVALKLAKVTLPRTRKLLLIFSISTNLGLLVFFKYTNFLLGSAHVALGWLGFAYQSRVLEIVLPLGISFYTFETISYIVDVYQGKLEPIRSPLDYALYIMFFPHLLAGPIVRPNDFLPQLAREKRFSWNRLSLGLWLFLIGLVKKAVIADHAAAIVDPIFAHPDNYASSALWLGALGYAVQIYCDFSGYSDMAIGAAHALGFKLPRNFNRPYLAANITDFWRRWHISLSSWLRDYLYIPLGGNRGGRWATYRNLLLTMLLGGFWHGANWTFAAWGLYHGLLLSLHRAVRFPFAGYVGRVLATVGTFLVVVIGWVLFRAQTFGAVRVMLAGMFTPTVGRHLDSANVSLALACLLATLAGHVSGEWIPWHRVERRLPAPLLGGAMVALLLLVQLLMPATGKAFIYFRF
jgi:alginate O-acetyltransferase complex protein AlgI